MLGKSKYLQGGVCHCWMGLLLLAAKLSVKATPSLSSTALGCSSYLVYITISCLLTCGKISIGEPEVGRNSSNNRSLMRQGKDKYETGSRNNKMEMPKEDGDKGKTTHQIPGKHDKPQWKEQLQDKIL